MKYVWGPAIIPSAVLVKKQKTNKNSETTQNTKVEERTYENRQR